MRAEIRELRENDYEEFHNLYSQILLEAFPEFSSNIKNFLSAKEKTRKRFDNPIKFGAFISGKMIGYIIVGKPGAGVTKIDWLGIRKDYQNNRIGSNLIDRAEKLAKQRGVHNIQLICDKHLAGFYQRNGYEIIGLDEKSYFGLDTYIMKKLLQEPKEENFLDHL